MVVLRRNINATVSAGTPARVSDPVLRALRDGANSIDLNDPERPLSHVILGPPFRDYFIKRVKNPFKKAIMLYAKKYPEPTKRNTAGYWTAPIMDVFDKLLSYADYNEQLFAALRRIALGEIEHDILYRDPLIAMLEWLIEKVLDGEILPRNEMSPPQKYWKEPPPYGGKYTIIYRIRQHRKEINDLLGRKHKEEA